MDLDGIQALQTVFGRSKDTTVILRIDEPLYPSLLKSPFYAGLREKGLVVNGFVEDSEIPEKFKEAHSLRLD